MEVRAKKRLGQHFLTDLTVAERIAASLELTERTPVLEIGPGMGVLTQFLLKDANVDLTAIELDSESVVYLHEHYPELKVIEGDLLKSDLKKLYGDEKFVIIGNFPYNISSQIFFKVLEYRDQIPLCAGMIQKEVAERIASRHGNKTYGITSVLLQAFYDIEYLFTVHEHVFNPPPKVKSAVIRMRRNGTKNLGCDEKLFISVVKTSFNQRRKTMRNSLKPIMQGRLLVDPVFEKRPEQLSVNEFIQLTNLVQEILSQPPSPTALSA
jgi:16S rRNA (adenine1518-N6/adenine1519-N6)-dimethyltransferase